VEYTHRILKQSREKLMSPVQNPPTIDFHSDRYREPFSRINGIVIEGEQEAYENFLSLAH